MNEISSSWMGLMWALVWQSTLAAGLIAAVAWMLRRSSPTVRYWLWQILAIKLLLMPFWTWAVPLPAWMGSSETEQLVVVAPSVEPALPGEERVEPAVPLETQLLEAQPHPMQREASHSVLATIRWQSWILIVWVAVVIAQFVRLVFLRIRLARLLRGGSPADMELIALLSRLAEEMGLRNLPSIVLVEADCSPFVCGLYRPRLVMPAELQKSLDPSQLRQVLLHELAHIKRRDLLWGWTAEIARMVYFFHPVAHWASYQIRLERELACDQLAMAHSGEDAAQYAETLLRVASSASEPDALKAAAASASLDGGKRAIRGDK